MKNHTDKIGHNLTSAALYRIDRLTNDNVYYSMLSMARRIPDRETTRLYSWNWPTNAFEATFEAAYKTALDL